MQRGDLPEAPPSWFKADQPLPPGYHEQVFPTREQVDAWCRAWGVSPHDEYTRRMIAACYAPALKTVAYPDEHAPGVDKTWLDATRAHERFHMLTGAVHNANGRGWVLPMKNLPVPVTRPQGDK